MIITADWVLPVASPPVAGGALLVHPPRILELGSLEHLAAAHPSEPVERFDGCVIMPGLINAHTHLSLTVLRGLVPDVPLPEWLPYVTRGVRAMSDDDFAASASLGATECLLNGVTSVGDIVYGPEPLASCADVGVGGVFFWEVLGLDAGDLSGELAEREFPSVPDAYTTGHTRCGISPHTAYTSGPELLRATWNVAHRHRIGYAIHVAESAAEHDLMISGSGPLAGPASRLAHGFSVPRSGTVAYLDNIGVLKDALAVHCVHLEPGDVARLERSARGVVLCPRSNKRLHNGAPPISELSASRVRLAIGTDSAASNDDLDLLEEARHLHKLDRSLTSRRLLQMVTVEGARALGLDDIVGTLEPGKQADLAVFRVPAGADPETAIARKGGGGAICAAMSQGLWRVRDGAAAFALGAIERDAARVRERVEAVLAET